MIYADRQGNQKEVVTRQDKLLGFVYSHVVTRILLRPFLSPVVSKAGGWLMDTRFSALFVPSFVRKNHIDLNEYERRTFSSYNDFFTRKIKKGKRPVTMDKEILISPCDGKLSVYPIEKEGHFCIKHTPYTVSSLLKNKKLAVHYEGGYAIVVRLTVDDYHRYCYVDDGVKSEQRSIEGIFHTVNPAANDAYPIYKMNAREYCLIKTENFGTIVMMEVGALLVGRICNNQPERGFVKKGEEKGRFEFGGSTVVLLLEKDRAVIDTDLLENSKKGYETIVRMGEQIGRIVTNLFA